MSTARSRTKFQWKQWLAALAASIPILSIHVEVVWCSDRSLFEQTEMWPLVKPICLIIGAVIGAIFADICGRKRSLVLMWLFTIVGLTIFILFMYFDLPSLIAFAFIPFGSGITCVLIALYLSEISGTNNCRNLMTVPLLVHCIRVFVYNTADALNTRSQYAPFVTYVAIFATTMLFHGIMMCVCPETPQYLNWKKRYHETGKSLDFYKGIDQVGLRHDPSNPSIPTSIAGNYWGQGCCERIRELFKFENRRNLAVIFCLIVIRRASGQDQNFRFLFYTLSSLHDYYKPSSHLPLVGFCSLTLIFSIVVMSTMGLLARKLSASFVMLVYFIFTILGIVRLESNWAIIGVVFVQYLCQIVLIAVTLACLGKFFTINIRAMAIAIAVTFEILMTSVFDLIYPVYGNVNYSEDMSVLMYSKCGVVLAGLFILFIFFPKTKELPYSEIPIDSSANEECLPVQQLAPVIMTTNVACAT